MKKHVLTSKGKEYKKAWIYPDGSVVSLIQSYHYYHILDELESIRKKYGITFSKEDLDDDTRCRKHCLSNGFCRVNYEISNGTITFELMKRFWIPSMLKVIKKIVSDNSNNIDKIAVNLFDDDWSYKGDSVFVFKIKNKDKTKHIPFL